MWGAQEELPDGEERQSQTDRQTAGGSAVSEGPRAARLLGRAQVWARRPQCKHRGRVPAVGVRTCEGRGPRSGGQTRQLRRGD